MAGTLKADGLDALGRQLAEIGNKAQEIASGSLYYGAKVVADAMNGATKDIKTESFHYAPDGHTRLPSPQERAALERKVGIAAFRKTGDSVDTLIGISYGGSGYTQIAGKKKAVAVIARSINSGTSFMEKQPVYRRAISKAKSAAVQATVEAADKKIKELTK